MKKYINSFKEMLESFEVVNQRNINIGEFENELTHRQEWELSRWSVDRMFESEETNALNLYFGTYRKPGLRHYTFNLNFGSFGAEKINFSGFIFKKYELDNSGEKLHNLYFLINGDIKVKLGNDIGMRTINIKLNNINDVLNFFKNFDSNLDLTID